MNDDLNLVSFNADEVIKLLENFDVQSKSMAKSMMRAVNNEAKKRIRREAKSRGYQSHHEQSWGDSGYTKNLVSYANNDFSGKISIKKNAFYYRFIESGANVSWRHRKGNFYYRPNPFIKSISDNVWRNESSAIMEKEFKKQIEKLQRNSK